MPSSEILMHPAAVFVRAEMVSPRSPHLKSAFVVPSDRMSMDKLIGISFQTFNMEVSFLIYWAFQDFLLLLITMYK